MTDYWELPGLADYYLEDSYVTWINQDTESLAMGLIVVLRESHPDYSPPPPTEQYCYRDARLEFTGVKTCSWSSLDINPTVEPDGSVDFGNIHSLRRAVDQYQLYGDFGAAVIMSNCPTIQLTSPSR